MRAIVKSLLSWRWWQLTQRVAQAWALMEEECHNLDLARDLLLDASEKDPCDLYVWQVGWVARQVSSVGQAAHLRHSSKRKQRVCPRHGNLGWIFGQTTHSAARYLMRR